jgi:hypothetical protein
MNDTRKYTPVEEIHSDKLSFEHILLARMQRVDSISEKYARTKDVSYLREFFTALENYYGFILTLGTQKDIARLHGRIMPLRKRVRAMWGYRAIPPREQREECFAMMVDLWNVLRGYSMSQGRIVPTTEMVLLTGVGVFSDDDIMEVIQDPSTETPYPPKAERSWNRYNKKVKNREKE